MATSINDQISAKYTIGILVAILVILFLKHHASKKVDPREPPVVSSTIPYAGHVVGMLCSGSNYLKQLGRQYTDPIFTLPTFNSRLYIVTDPSLATSVQRATKTLSFTPIIPPVLQSVYGFDKSTKRLIESDMTHGFVQKVQEKVHARLGHGHYLDQLSLRACNEFLIQLKREDNNSLNNIDLLKWIKRLVTVSTAIFFYGPNNPVEKDPTLVDRFWEFDAGIPQLLVGIIPWLTARKAYSGREAMVSALQHYLTSPQYLEAAELTKERTEIARMFGVDDENTARSDLTFFFAGIINTSLTSFWMVLHIFADPSLLTTIRAELKSAMSQNPPDRTTKTTAATLYSGRLSITQVTKQCHVLNAVFREVLRMYSDNFATRIVLSDTLLADTYLLRAGSIVQISGGIIHADEKIWGSDVNIFRPQRFLHPSNTSTATTPTSARNELPTTNHDASNDHGISSKKPDRPSIHAAAFRAFGGGTTLCPGRHFAHNEIMGLVALIILQFDITPPSIPQIESQSTRSTSQDPGTHRGKLEIPLKQDRVIPIHVLEPVKMVQVDIERLDLGGSGIELEA